MSINADDSDSEIEVLNSQSLRSSYFRQQLKLIKDIKEVNRFIPKNWENFKEFIYFNIAWQPPVNLIRSVWKKLCLAEQEASGKRLPLEVIELSDDEQSDDCSIVSVIPSDERTSALKEKNADSVLKQKPTALIEPIIQSHMLQGNAQSGSSKRKSSKKSSNDAQEKCEIDLCTENKNSNKGISEVPDDSTTEKVKKKVSKKRRKSSLNEAEAELMRQILLIDKLIELNLPTVLETVIPNFSPSCLDSSGMLTSPDFSQIPKKKRATQNKNKNPKMK